MLSRLWLLLVAAAVANVTPRKWLVPLEGNFGTHLATKAWDPLTARGLVLAEAVFAAYPKVVHRSEESIAMARRELTVGLRMHRRRSPRRCSIC